MVIEAFPPLESADEHGLLAVGGDVEVESLLLAYRSGIFPWPVDEEFLTWFSPPRRALLYLNEFHISRSLRRFLQTHTYEIWLNRDFPGVVDRCAEVINRGTQGGTWITSELKYGYLDLHNAGHAHSIEVYEKDELIGGLYGVSLGTMFVGESMFFRKPNASKLALTFTAHYLRERGCRWIDCQVLTPLLKQFGAREIARVEFICELKRALAENPIDFPHQPKAVGVWRIPIKD